MGAQNFNVPLNLHQNGGFPAPNFVFVEEHFPTRKEFSDRLKLRGRE